MVRCFCTGNIKIDFGRTPMKECSAIERRKVPDYEAWKPQSLDGGAIKKFRASLGPAGGAKGYTAITGEQTENNSTFEERPSRIVEPQSHMIVPHVACLKVISHGGLLGTSTTF